MQTPPILNTQELIRSKTEMLEALLELEIAFSMTRKGLEGIIKFVIFVMFSGLHSYIIICVMFSALQTWIGQVEAVCDKLTLCTRQTNVQYL